MSRLDDLSRTSPVQPSSPTAAATQRALESDNTPPENTPPPATANALTGITVQQLYVFLWKLFAAVLLFSLPFLLIYLIIAAIAH